MVVRGRREGSRWGNTEEEYQGEREGRQKVSNTETRNRESNRDNPQRRLLKVEFRFCCLGKRNYDVKCLHASGEWS